MREYAYQSSETSMAEWEAHLRESGKTRKELMDLKKEYQEMRSILLQKFSHYIVQQRSKHKGSQNMTAEDVVVLWNVFSPYFIVLTTSRDEGNKLWSLIFQKAQEKQIVHSVDKHTSNPIMIVSVVSLFTSSVTIN